MFLRKILKRNFGYSAFVWSTANIGGTGTVKPKSFENFKNKITDISISDNHGAFVTEEGQLYTYGKNDYG